MEEIKFADNHIVSVLDRQSVSEGTLMAFAEVEVKRKSLQRQVEGLQVQMEQLQVRMEKLQTECNKLSTAATE